MKILSYTFLKTVTLGEFTAMEVWGLSVLKRSHVGRVVADLIELRELATQGSGPGMGG